MNQFFNTSAILPYNINQTLALYPNNKHPTIYNQTCAFGNTTLANQPYLNSTFYYNTTFQPWRDLVANATNSPIFYPGF